MSFQKGFEKVASTKLMRLINKQIIYAKDGKLVSGLTPKETALDPIYRMTKKVFSNIDRLKKDKKYIRGIIRNK